MSLSTLQMCFGCKLPGNVATITRSSRLFDGIWIINAQFWRRMNIANISPGSREPISSAMSDGDSSLCTKCMRRTIWMVLRGIQVDKASILSTIFAIKASSSLWKFLELIGGKYRGKITWFISDSCLSWNVGFGGRSIFDASAVDSNQLNERENQSNFCKNNGDLFLFNTYNAQKNCLLRSSRLVRWYVTQAMKWSWQAQILQRKWQQWHF